MDCRYLSAHSINDLEVCMSEKEMLSIDPAKQQSKEVYKLLIGSVLPRPIAFVSTVDKNNVRNLAPFSFFTVASANPPVVVFCTSVPANERSMKDTLRNVMETREFVVNIVSEDFAEQMNQCSATVPPEVDEFALSGLTPIPSDLVKPARVAESLVQMECRLLQVLTVSEKPMGGNLVLGEVVRFHVAQDVVSNFQIDPEKLRAIGRMAGVTYCRTTDRFELKRP
jgi:flavin reductase (DIM6/NTAB) family NADH-FMN oxidoreductase RutF